MHFCQSGCIGGPFVAPIKKWCQKLHFFQSGCICGPFGAPMTKWCQKLHFSLRVVYIKGPSGPLSFRKGPFGPLYVYNFNTSPIRENNAFLLFFISGTLNSEKTSESIVHQNFSSLFLPLVPTIPSFQTNSSDTVFAPWGGTATIQCTVRNLGDRAVRNILLFTLRIRIDQNVTGVGCNYRWSTFEFAGDPFRVS